MGIGIKPRVFIAARIGVSAAPSGEVRHLAALEAGLPLWFARVAAVNHAHGAAQPVLKAKACGDRFSDDTVCRGHEQQLVAGNAVVVDQCKCLVQQHRFDALSHKLPL